MQRKWWCGGGVQKKNYPTANPRKSNATNINCELISCMFIAMLRTSFRYQGMWKLFGVFFMFFYVSRLCCIGISMMKHRQNKPCWKLDLSWLGYGYRKCMFIDSLTKYIGLPPNCVRCGVWSTESILKL
jgi:hypothetical protein